MRTFSQFGGTSSRNLYTLKQTYAYISVCVLWVFLDNLLIETLQFFDDQLDRKTSFIIYNTFWFCLIDFFFGLFVPIKHIFTSCRTLPVLWNRVETHHEERFFMSVRRLEPRRDFEMKEIAPRGIEFRSTREKIEGSRKLPTIPEEENKSPGRKERPVLVPIDC